MAKSKEDGVEVIATMHQDMESPKLTFAALDARIEALPDYPPDQAASPTKASWWFALGAAGVLLALLSPKLFPSHAIYTLVLTAVGVIAEAVGFILALISQIPTRWPTFASERRDWAERLDFELPAHLALLEWLRSFPLDQRETLSAFVSYRLEQLREKLPMLTGGMEKLGALPIVIALYLQFKDMHWPPHPSWIEILLIFALILVYWLSVTHISVRLRLQRYEALLRKACT